jgi:hypothetical protein
MAPRIEVRSLVHAVPARPLGTGATFARSPRTGVGPRVALGRTMHETDLEIAATVRRTFGVIEQLEVGTGQR